MRKDTLIMTLTMVIVTIGVYYGLEIFLRGNADDHGNQFEVTAPPSRVITTSEGETGEVPDDVVIEDDAAASYFEDTVEEDSTDEEVVEEMMVADSEPEEATEEAAPVVEPEMVTPDEEAEVVADAPTGDQSSASADELTEIAVQAAIDEAVKAASEAAEKAVREAMEARRSADQ